ncbi:DUF2062 domain-containing protein [Desulfosediminicola ganghwensis]|uniref:DUF2062 domain-containing protein n=1 Tax=Desulfosediminicola ganghwensis TaxID=2569540 RepID=UPI0010ABC6E0|nr:DUF2062 domain-containing protein [Desulfosediminicola ganghwensis]
MQIGRLGKYYFRRLQRLKGDPIALAGGFAIGVFIGFTPTMPLHTVAIIIATLATRTSTIAGILSSWVVCNPLTYFPIYYFSLVIGNAVTPYHLNWVKIKTTLDLLLTSESISQSMKLVMGLGCETIVVMLVGGIILALPFTIMSFYLSLKFFIAVKQKRAQKQILN